MTCMLKTIHVLNNCYKGKTGGKPSINVSCFNYEVTKMFDCCCFDSKCLR